GLDVTNDTVSPRFFDDATRYMDDYFKHDSISGALTVPYKLLAALAVPNFVRAGQVTAHNQTIVDQAQIACALERYRLAHSQYPETLDALIPQFMEKIPHDIIGGQPLHYRRTTDGKFLLYSVGWNETDDGGLDLSPKGGINYTNGDWVWKN
ncbi:MAG TPA: hypothetical protein VN516_04710, partial [Candidatus Baltobacteraceae bacterium]|nr:hypothetical protein [Candidatus Baltobacteraceae bacterium]